MVDRDEFETTRRTAWKALGLAGIGTAVGGLGSVGAAIYGSNRPEQETSREISRGNYNQEELEQLEACVDDDDMRGLGESIDELLNSEEGRTVINFEYVHDGTGSPSDVGSSFRYEVELEGTGETHDLGWYSVENEVLEPFAEAENHDGSLQDYAEANC